MPYWAWWQWALAITGGFLALIVALVVIIIVLFICAIAIDNRNEKVAIKKSHRYVTVVEKLAPALSFTNGPLGNDLSLLSSYPWELGEPTCFELLVRARYAVLADPGDDEPTYWDKLDFTIIVDQDTYKQAVVGGRIENPLYEEPKPTRQYATEPVS